jgi:tetratricopeptide (TPR) repeat protein
VLFLGLVLAVPPQDPTLEQILQAYAERMELSRTPADERGAAALALEQLRALPADHPEAPRIAFHVAEMLAAQGRRAEAADAFEAFARERRDEPNAATALLEAAQLRELLDQFDAAATLYETFGRRFPGDARGEAARIQSALCRLYGGAEQACRAELERLDSWAARLRLALVDHMTEQQEACRRRLAKVRAECPERPTAEAAAALLDQMEAVGRPLPELKIGAFSTAAARGRAQVLVRFSAFSPQAAAEAETLDRILRRHGERVAVAGICVDAVPEAPARYRERLEPRWTLVHDPYGRASAAAPGAGTAPGAVVADAEGRVRWIQLAGRDLEFVTRRLLGH